MDPFRLHNVNLGYFGGHFEKKNEVGGMNLFEWGAVKSGPVFKLRPLVIHPYWNIGNIPLKAIVQSVSRLGAVNNLFDYIWVDYMQSMYIILQYFGDHFDKKAPSWELFSTISGN